MAKKVTEKPGKALTAVEKELAEIAAISAGIEKDSMGGGSYISTRGGHFTFNGGEVPDDKLNVIILDSVIERALYEGRYDPDSPNPPICFAIAHDPDGMGPHENSPAPQNDICETCPMNEWGSADMGKGKACKERRRLALLPEDALDDLEKAEAAFLRVPVTSVKAWAGYVASLNDTLKKPTLAVITEISIVPDAKLQYKLKFRALSTIDDAETLGTLLARRKAVQTVLCAPFAAHDEEEEAPPTKQTRVRPAAKPVVKAKPVARKPARR